MSKKMETRYVVLSLIQNEWGLDHQGDKDFFWATSPESAINQCKKYIENNGTGPYGDREDFRAFIEDSNEFNQFVSTHNMFD
jgi:hypothetical protein